MEDESIEQKLYWLQQQINTAVLFIGLTTFFVGLKLWASMLRMHKAKESADGLNLALIFSALVAFLLLSVVTIFNATAFKAYYESTSTNDQDRQFVIIYKTDYVFSVVYPIACALPKLSLCVFYIRLFGIYVWISRISKALIAFLVVNAIAWLVPSILVCKPISQFWNPEGHQGRCLDYNTFGTWISLPHIMSDLVILALPLPVLYKQQMKPGKKIGLIFTFLTASFGVITACLRLASYIRRTYVERPGTNETTASIALDTMYSLFEPGSYLIAVCLLSLRVIFIELRKTVGTGLTTILKKLGTPDTSTKPSPQSGDLRHELTNQTVDLDPTGVRYL